MNEDEDRSRREREAVARAPAAPESPRPPALARGFAWAVAGPVAFLIPIAWIVAAVAAVVYLPSIESTQATVGDLTPGDAPAVRAERQAARLFATPALSRIALVQRDPEGLSQAAIQRTVSSAAALDKHQAAAPSGLLGALPVINVPGVVSGSGETATTAVTFLFFDPSVAWETQVGDARSYARTAIDGPDSPSAMVTGTVPARLAQSAEIDDKLLWVEVATIALIALIVGVTFRSFGAPAVTLAAGAISYVIALRVVAWVGLRTGLTAPSELEPLIVVLLLGIVTDYAIFYLSGMRHRLESGAPRGRAARQTTGEFTPIILVAGLMVAGGTAALAVATQHFFRAFGPGLALTVLIGLAVATTLVPALLAIFGRLVYWPRSLQASAAKPAATRRRLAHLATSRPMAALITVLVVAVLVAAATGIRRTAFGLDLISSLPAETEVKQAADQATTGFGGGILSPTEVALRQQGLGDRTPSLVRLQDEIARRQGIAAVVGPREALATSTAGSMGGLPLAVSEDGSAARYLVVFAADPLGSTGIARLRELQDAMPSLLAGAGLGGAAVSYAGDTALAQNTVDRTMSDLGRIAIAVIVVDLLLLALLLRSLLAPIYLLAASVLALAAALGVTTYLFQVLLGGEDITYYVPFAAAVLLVSLGSDYNIFLVGRIWEEAKVRPMRRAIEIAVPRARHAISVAAVALALSFGLLGIIGLSSFRQLAFLLLVGVLIDSFLVRSLLVPAMVALFAPLGQPSAGDLTEPDVPQDVARRRAA